MNIRGIVTTLLSTFGASCAYLQPAPAPMRVIEPVPPTAASRTLVVFLPGRWDEPERFVKEGFFTLLGDTLPGAAAVSPDASIGYYLRGTVVPRLRADVVEPAHRLGVTELDFVGVSLGGLGSMLYAKQNPGVVDTIVALAPYLGDRKVIDEIAVAGGLAAWSPKLPLGKDDYQRDLWLWLKGYARRDPAMPQLILAWGEDDDLAPACRLLAAELPPAQVFPGPGGHDWRTWKALFTRIVDSRLLKRPDTGR